MNAIININIEVEIPKNIKTEAEAEEYLFNYELPGEYVEDSYEFVKFIDEDGKDLWDDNN